MFACIYFNTRDGNRIGLSEYPIGSDRIRIESDSVVVNPIIRITSIFSSENDEINSNFQEKSKKFEICRIFSNNFL